jgi:hypothetical protein
MRKHPPSPADEADRLALDRAVENMIQGVLSGWDHARPLGSLSRQDLRRIADAAITGWVLKRAELAECGNAEIAEELNSSAVFAG